MKEKTQCPASASPRSSNPPTPPSRFARRVAESRGRIADADLAALRAAGFDEAGTIEIVINVALNVLTNYVNNVAGTDIDFPKVSTKLAA